MSLDTLANYCVYVVKVRACEHDMLCTLQINKADLNEHVKSEGYIS